ncbi:MAG: carbonic anhydrase [Flavobacteriales bacterium]
MTHQEAFIRLKEGNRRFVSDTLERKQQGCSRRKALALGQSPFAILLSCADSRVVPELIFDTGLGELFTVRIAGNIANTSSMASIEYAVAHCGSKLIVVLGHQSCGAVTAAVNGGEFGSNLKHLLAHVRPAVEASADKNQINEVIKLNAKMTADVLKNQSDIIRNAVDSGEVKIIPAYYNLDSGAVDFFD